MVNFERMAKFAQDKALQDGFVKLTWQDVVEILQSLFVTTGEEERKI